MENKQKTAYFLILFFLLSLIFLLFYGRLGSFFFDISREVYIPQAVNEGSVLYKDIFNVYAPLGYQLNAFITAVFGNSLNMFYILGFINSVFILGALYLIACLFLNVRTAAVFCIFIITACIFSNFTADYIFPYSYSMIYALNAFLWALLSLLYFVKTGRKLFLYASFLLFGASIAFKYEFILFGLVLAFFFFKNTNLKEKCICLAAFIFIPFLSFFDLCLKGVNIEDMQNAANYMIMLSKSESVKNLYSYLGFIPSLYSLKILLLSLGYFLLSAALLLIPFLLKEKFSALNGFKRAVFNILNTALFAGCIFIVFKCFASEYNFSWLGLFSVLILIYMLIKRRLNDKLFLFLVISTVIAGVKCIFNVSLSSYGNYYMPLFLLCLIVFVNAAVPEDKRSITEKCTVYLLGTMSVIYLFFNLNNTFIYHTDLIKTDKGIFYADKNYAAVINDVITFVKTETKPEDKVLILPDGAMINYFTDRKSDNKYYYLTPPNVEIFGAENIIKDLKKNPPKYIVIHPVMYFDYLQTSFCSSFGSEICAFVKDNYNLERIFKNEQTKFSMKVYKKRDSLTAPRA